MITDKVQLFWTYQVSAWVRIGSGVRGPQKVKVNLKVNDKEEVKVCEVEVNGDTWHEIVGSFRIETKPCKVMVYVHGPDKGVDLMLAGLRIFAVDRRARFEHLKKKTDKVIDTYVV